MSALPRTAPQAERDALRRGWCPSTLKPMETGDGWLVRLHPPGARLVPQQLERIAALAAAHGSGLVDISARANLQIRGVTPASHPALVERLLAEGLVDEHDGDGPQRLTLVSPLAGADGYEGGRIDAVSLAGEIERQGRTIPGLPPKLSVVVDDGGAFPLDGFACDLRLVGIGGGLVALGLADRRWLGPLPESAVAAAVAAVLNGFAGVHRAAPARIRRLRDLSDMALAALIDLPGTAPPARRPPPRRAGLFALAHERFAVLIGLPFGRGEAGTLAKLATAAPADAGIRLSPWRGLAFRGLDRAGAQRLLAQAENLGLIVKDGDPRLSVQACAGSPACSRAEGPAMAAADRLAEIAADLLAQGATLHVSGCVKACAHPGSADLTLTGRAGRYDVVLGGTTRDAPCATLDLSALEARLQPGQEIRARLAEAARRAGPRG
ncbi:precorrin-3B synthase [Bosea minatitlanensis]|uniref:precorrin-3B synthase n=1 Tax=Bosea minatitlanensis TaxID=128782 RepID=UPI0021A5E262|nr:precorrin-3B synthase [Bosea minatitlanensis]MCT4494329.1 precorrin-3B synthase [Bosea minatitlanensis]